MSNAALLTLAGLCLGLALSGLLGVALRKDRPRERLALAVVYVSFIGMIALPIVKTFAAGALIHTMPVLLVLLLALPPALYHFVAAKTGQAPSHIPWRDRALPLAATLVCIGYWTLSTEAKETMFIAGDLPPGVWPATLALLTFGLIMLWLIASFAYLVAILHRLAAYRKRIRDLFSDADDRDQRWIDGIIAVLVMIWAAGAASIAGDNLARGPWLIEEVFLLLIAVGLMVLNSFAPINPPDTPPEVEDKESTPETKYARSALTQDHAAKLADRLQTAMQKDALYLDPALSLQKLSQQVGALPNHVSQTLNQEIGATFFDYVSRWRIEASKPRITAGTASVLDVAMDVGFNSRSAFYKAFKRETGMTPKDYRKAHGGAV
ncbi:helix-turn-helix domain-containing protein [Shimia ponticola]|uniref:helix-turn-helix domain-containing protein n=1 Tax=Shimia ponticola TaxID=2582893 RepID=UPI00164CBBB0|nr:AraC family transcriptional regulator [Shimia ponticola]